MPTPFDPEDAEFSCYVCASPRSVGELLDAANRFSNKNAFVQLLDDTEEARGRILPAYFNSLLRHKDRMMRSKGIGKEMLLLISGESNISRAIEKSGIKNSKRFILFASNSRIARSFIKSEKIRFGKCRLSFKKEDATKVVGSLLSKY